MPDATLDDLDPALVQAYLEKLGYPLATAGEATAAPPQALSEDHEWSKALLARGCLTQTGSGPVPSYAGVLLFGRQPQRYLRNAQITLVRYAGPQMGDEFLRHDAAGALPDQIRQAETFVTANMRRGMRHHRVHPPGDHRVSVGRRARGDRQRGRAPRLRHPRR